MGGNVNSEFRYLLKVHNDVITVPEVIKNMYQEYGNLGYRLGIVLPCSFSYYLEDDTEIMVYWEKGYVYEDIVDPTKYFGQCNEDHVEKDLDIEECRE